MGAANGERKTSGAKERFNASSPGRILAAQAIYLQSLFMTRVSHVVFVGEPERPRRLKSSRGTETGGRGAAKKTLSHCKRKNEKAEEGQRNRTAKVSLRWGG